MMNCEKIKKFLPEYSVGGFSKKKRKFIEQHIKICSECMKELEQLKNVASLLDSVPQEEPPSFLWDNIQSEIANQNNVSFFHKIFSWIWEKRIPVLIPSFGVLIIMLGVYFWVLKLSTNSEPQFYAEVEQHTFSNWSSPFADRVALGMVVMKAELGNKDDETIY